MPRAATLLLLIFAALTLFGMASAGAPTVAVSASPPSVTSGFGTTFTALGSGGTMPKGASYIYNWQVPDGLTKFSGTCVPGSSTCTVYGTVSTPTDFKVSVSVTDSAGVSSSTKSASVSVTPYKCIIGTAGDLGSCVADAIPLAVMGILLSLLMVAIAFVLGEVTKIEGFLGWYKSELWEVTKSVLLIAVVFGTIVILSNISSSMVASTSASQGSMLASAAPCASSSLLTSNLCTLYQSVYSGYLGPQLTDAYDAFSAIFGLSIGVGAVKSIFVSTWLPIPIPPFPEPLFAIQFGSTFPLLQSNYLEPASSAATFSFIKDIMILVVSPVFLAMKFQYDLLPTLVVLSLGVLLPVGIILRSMPFLRGIGGTMIGIAIAVAIIYPTLLLVLNMPVTNYFSYVFAPHAPQAPCSGSSGLGSLFCEIQYSIVTTATDALSFGAGSAGYSVLGTVINPVNANGDLYTQGLRTGLYNIGSIFPALNFVLATTSNTLLQFLLFIVDLILTITSANMIAKPLGGKVRLGIGKMKLA